VRFKKHIHIKPEKERILRGNSKKKAIIIVLVGLRREVNYLSF